MAEPEKQKKLLHILICFEISDIIKMIFNDDAEKPSTDYAKRICLTVLRRLCSMLETAEMKPEHIQESIKLLQEEQAIAHITDGISLEVPEDCQDQIDRIFESSIFRLQKRLEPSKESHKWIDNYARKENPQD